MTATIEPVRKTLTVAASPERAFEVFTSGMSTWWPRTSHHISDAEESKAFVEPREGGRWYERDQNGAECEWGHVITWEPPTRVVLAWQLTAEWKYDPDFVTEVEVRFIPDGDETRVEFEHRGIERFGEAAETTRAALDSEGGWSGLLADYQGAF